MCACVRAYMCACVCVLFCMKFRCFFKDWKLMLKDGDSEDLCLQIRRRDILFGCFCRWGVQNATGESCHVENSHWTRWETLRFWAGWSESRCQGQFLSPAVVFCGCVVLFELLTLFVLQMWIPHLNISSSTAHKQGIPVFIGTFIFGAVTNKSDISLWKLPREITLTILTYSMRFAEVIFFSSRFSRDGSWSQRSDHRAVYGQR